MKRAMAMAGLLLLGIGPNWADEGRIPIFRPVILDGTAPGTIEGHYLLTRSFAAPAGQAAIDIIGTGMENIEIDLNGFTIASSTFPTIRVGGSGVRSLVLMNGTVERSNVGGRIIEVLGIHDTVTDDLVIENLKVRGGNSMPDTAIHVTDVNKVVIRDNIIQRTHTGILIRDTNMPPFSISGRIVRNQIQTVDTTCIDLATASSFNIRENTMVFVGTGIQMADSRAAQVVGNSISVASGDGLSITGASRAAYVSNNTFDLGSGSGDAIALYTAWRCMLIDNVISESGGDGIFIGGGGQHQIERNVVSMNVEFGLHLDNSSGNVYRNNTFRNNGAMSPPACTSASPCGTPAVCDENGGTNNFAKENVNGSGECP